MRISDWSSDVCSSDLQTLDADSPPDLKEGYYYTADLPDDDPYVQAGIRGYGGNQWPPAMAGFDAAGFAVQMRAYYAALRNLGDRLLRLLALSLDLPAGLDRKSTRLNSSH